MARIYRRTDRIKVKIDEIVLTLAPMSIDQKMQVQELSLQGQLKRDLKAATKAIALSMKFSIKDIKGLTDSDGNEYVVTLENGDLTDDCVDELFDLSFMPKIAVVCSSLANKVPDSFSQLEGVEILPSVKEANDPN